MGIADAAARAFTISPWEVEAAEEPLWDNTAGLPSVYLERERGHGLLRQSKLFEWASTLCGDRSDVCFHISCPMKQSILFVSNSAAAAASIVWTSEDIKAMLGAHALLITLLYTGCVAESDRRAWFELFVDCVFGKGHKTCSRLIKSMDREGQIRVHLFKARSIFCPEIGDNVMLTCIERAPSSRYLLETPGYPNKVINRPPTTTTTSPVSPSSSSLPPSSLKEVAAPLPLWEIDEEKGRTRVPSPAPWLQGEVGAALRRTMLHELEGGEQQHHHHHYDHQEQQQLQQQLLLGQHQSQQQQQKPRTLSVPGVATIPDPRPWLWCKALVGREEEATEQQQGRGREAGVKQEGERKEEGDQIVMPSTSLLFSPLPSPSPSFPSPSFSMFAQMLPPLSSSFACPVTVKEEETKDTLGGEAEGAIMLDVGNSSSSDANRGYVNAESLMPPLGEEGEGEEEEVPIFDQGALDSLF